MLINHALRHISVRVDEGGGDSIFVTSESRYFTVLWTLVNAAVPLSIAI